MKAQVSAETRKAIRDLIFNIEKELLRIEYQMSIAIDSILINSLKYEKDVLEEYHRNITKTRFISVYGEPKDN